MRRRQKSNPSKGYPRRVLEKYGLHQESASRHDTKQKTMNSESHPPYGETPGRVPETEDAREQLKVESGRRDHGEEGHQRKTEKRPDPQTVAEFLEAFYAGRAKVLSEATLRRLKATAVVLDPNARGDLLRLAIDVDESLDKTRRLTLLASEVSELKALGHLLLEFAVDVVLLHPAVRTNRLRAHLFPLYGDEYTLEDAWRLMTPPKTAEATGPHQGIAARIDNGESTLTEPTLPRGEQSQRTKDQKAAATARALQAIADKARRNALLCSVVWRVHRNLQTFSDAMRSLRGTLFSLENRPPSLEIELLEAIALMPEKEDSKVALLLEWTARQQADVLKKLNDALRRADLLAAQEAATASQLADAIKRVAILEAQLKSELASKEELGRHIGVVKTHGQADYEELRASSLRAVRDAVQQLEQVSVALGRDIPKVPFAREVLDTIVDSLRVTTKKLEDT